MQAAQSDAWLPAQQILVPSLVRQGRLALPQGSVSRTLLLVRAWSLEDRQLQGLPWHHVG